MIALTEFNHKRNCEAADQATDDHNSQKMPSSNSNNQLRHICKIQFSFHGKWKIHTPDIKLIPPWQVSNASANAQKH